MEKLRSSVDFDRMGFSLALGALPKFVFKGKLNKVCRICWAEIVIGVLCIYS
jgi:hypothetical protein